MAVTQGAPDGSHDPRPHCGADDHPQAVVSARDLVKTYGAGDATVHALAGVEPRHRPSAASPR